MAFATGFEGLAQLLPCWRRDVQEGHVFIGKPLWFQWGFINKAGTTHALSWYVLVRLPSYVMKLPWWAEDNLNAEPTWHQRVLIFREMVPTGAGGWYTLEWECT